MKLQTEPVPGIRTEAAAHAPRPGEVLLGWEVLPEELETRNVCAGCCA